MDNRGNVLQSDINDMNKGVLSATALPFSPNFNSNETNAPQGSFAVNSQPTFGLQATSKPFEPTGASSRLMMNVMAPAFQPINPSAPSFQPSMPTDVNSLDIPVNHPAVASTGSFFDPWNKSQGEVIVESSLKEPIPATTDIAAYNARIAGIKSTSVPTTSYYRTISMNPELQDFFVLQKASMLSAPANLSSTFPEIPIPESLQNKYYLLVPLETRRHAALQNARRLQEPCITSLESSQVYRAFSYDTGTPVTLRRVSPFSTANYDLVSLSLDLWSRAIPPHPSIAALKGAFVTSEFAPPGSQPQFASQSLVWVHDYIPSSVSLATAHFTDGSMVHLQELFGVSTEPKVQSAWNVRETANQNGFTHSAVSVAAPATPSLFWSYASQLLLAIRHVHAHSAAVRCLSSAHVLVGHRNRVYISGIGTMELNKPTSRRLLHDAQVGDIRDLGVLLAEVFIGNSLGNLSSRIADALEKSPNLFSEIPAPVTSGGNNPNSSVSPVNLTQKAQQLVNKGFAIQTVDVITHIQMVLSRLPSSLGDFVYKCLTGKSSAMDLLHLALPFVADSFDRMLSTSDFIESQAQRATDNARLFRLLTKIILVADRIVGPDGSLSWIDTGTRYLVRQFRDFLFFQNVKFPTTNNSAISKNSANSGVSNSASGGNQTNKGPGVKPPAGGLTLSDLENATNAVSSSSTPCPVLDIGFIVDSLNKLDIGSSERILMTSVDGRGVIAVSYEQIKINLDSAFEELQIFEVSKLTTSAPSYFPNSSPLDFNNPGRLENDTGGIFPGHHLAQQHFLGGHQGQKIMQQQQHHPGHHHQLLPGHHQMHLQQQQQQQQMHHHHQQMQFHHGAGGNSSMYPGGRYMGANTGNNNRGF